MHSFRWQIQTKKNSACVDDASCLVDELKISIALRSTHSHIHQVVFVCDDIEIPLTKQCTLGGWNAELDDPELIERIRSLESAVCHVDFHGDLPTPLRLVLLGRVFDLSRLEYGPGQQLQESVRSRQVLLREVTVAHWDATDELAVSAAEWAVRDRNPDGSPIGARARADAVAAHINALSFFSELDVLSADGSEVFPLQEELTKVLYEFIKIRLKHAQSSTPSFPPPHNFPATVKQLKLESKASDLESAAHTALERLETLATKHFGDDENGERFGWAFECFASGRLFVEHFGLPETATPGPRLPDYAGLPNGTNFFLFLELALVSQGASLQSPFWLTRLPALFRATQVFVEHSLGWVDKENRVDGFREPDHFLLQISRKFELDRIRTIRRHYQALDSMKLVDRRRGTEKLFGQLIARSFVKKRTYENLSLPEDQLFRSCPVSLKRSIG